MGAIQLEGFADAAAWSASDPAGAPSTLLSLTLAGAPRLPGLSAPSAQVLARSGAEGHRLERVGSPVDLGRFPDLLLWVRGDRTADGSREHPFLAELRLGSTAAPVGSPGNGWRRLLPVEQPDTWRPVPLALDDLPPAVRQALTTVRITCLAVGSGWRLDLDAILAVRPELLADTDAALLERLGGRLRLDGSPVPAVVATQGGDTAAPPVLRIRHTGTRPHRGLAPVMGPRTDFTGTAFTERAPATVCELDYAVEAVAADRRAEAAMLEFVLAELAPTATLLSAGRVLTAEWVEPPAEPSSAPAERPAVHLRVRAALTETRPGRRAVPPYNTVRVEVDHRA